MPRGGCWRRGNKERSGRIGERLGGWMGQGWSGEERWAHAG